MSEEITPHPARNEKPSKNYIYFYLIRVVSNIILSIILLIALIYVVNYKQEVKEALGYSEPDRLMEIYEQKSNTKCFCYPITQAGEFNFNNINLPQS